MNRQVAICVFTFLGASTVSAGDSASGMLSKLTAVQWKEQNGGMLAFGATALTCFGAWKLNHWQYDYRYRNGDMEYKRQKMLALVPRLGDRLLQAYSEKRSNPENALTFEPCSFAVKQSVWDAPALQVTVAPSVKASEDDREYCSGVTITIANLLQAGQTMVVKSIFDTDASDRLDELRKVGVALSALDVVKNGFARLLASGASSTSWIFESHGCVGHTALEIGSADYAAMVANSLDDAGIKERLRNEQKLLSTHPLIKLEQTCSSDGKQATVSLTDMVSGRLINFAMQPACIFKALRRLELGWSRAPYAKMANGIRDVILAYATSENSRYWKNVRFSIADKIAAASEKPVTQWILVHEEGNQQKLVLPFAPQVHWNLLSEDTWNSALTTFLSSDALRHKKLSGKRKYIVGVPQFTQESDPAHELIQLVSFKIQPEENPADAVITVDSNNLHTDHMIVGCQGYSAADQLAHQTLRSHITATIADAHVRYTQSYDSCLPPSQCNVPDNGKFTLQLHMQQDGQLCYQVCDDQWNKLWQTKPFSLAGSSNADASAQQDEDMPRGAGMVCCGMLLPDDAYIYRSDDDREMNDESLGYGMTTCCGLFDEYEDVSEQGDGAHSSNAGQSSSSEPTPGLADILLGCRTEG